MSADKFNDTRNIDLGPGKEFDIVRALLSEWGKSAQHVGDDAAIVDVPAGEKLVITTDTSVDGVHFKHEWLNHFEIGRLLRSAISPRWPLARLAS
jgi:thiamine monophosphate kinase